MDDFKVVRDGMEWALNIAAVPHARGEVTQDLWDRYFAALDRIEARLKTPLERIASALKRLAEALEAAHEEER